MSPAIKAATKLQKERSRELEKDRSFELDATAVTARKVARLLGIELEKKDAQKAGYYVHFAHGVTTGAVFGLLASNLRRNGRRVPLVASGLLYGFGLWLLGDELAVPALKLAPPPGRFPASTHLKALAAHLAYGAGTGLGFDILRRPASALLH